MSEITNKITVSSSSFTETKKLIQNIANFKQEIEKHLNENVTEFLEIILIGAVGLDVSDLHIEPKKDSVKIRIRIDGILQDVVDIENEKYSNLLSRIKLLSDIKLNVSDRPQDGNFSILLEDKQDQDIEVRVSSLPTEYGESLVLRILNSRFLMSIEELGLRDDLLQLIKKEINRPNGMIVITGPTGSGKTTTLYAFLKKIHSSEVKIITIEDPIEYRLKGISQTEVAPKKGYDFANGLRSIMRQDPNVILVGEIRDSATAKIAIQAALTGHLVLSTIHTNDAAGTIARLVTLEANPANIGPALNIIIAQRLVRKACEKCSRIELISPQDLEKIKKELLIISENIKIKIPMINENLKVRKAQKCEYCNNTGYKGRIGIYEIILMDDEMEKFIIENSSIAALRKKAFERGMVTMKQDGFIKVLEGTTTIEEVERVSGE